MNRKTIYGLIGIFNEVQKKNQNVRLYLIGNGELRQEIEQEVRNLKLSQKVEFLGNIDECFDILNQADMFVMPSKWEGMPITIIEAMGTGLPIVASNVGGISNMIENGLDGYVVDNKEEFIKNIDMLYNNKALREKVGREAEKKSKKFSCALMTNEYIKLYNKREEK